MSNQNSLTETSLFSRMKPLTTNNGKRKMNVDLVGRIGNLNLPCSKPLRPLFETISNSIQAIEDCGEKNGEINIQVERSGVLSDPKDKALNPIKNFAVCDNGIGFKNMNYEAFNYSDTTIKRDRGGKGVGRLLGLIAFDELVVDSVYEEEGQFFSRKFTFSLEDNGVRGGKAPQKIEGTGTKSTKIILKNFNQKYEERCPKNLSEISTRIIEHFFQYFVSTDCPKITISDSATSEIINLNVFFNEEINPTKIAGSFTLKDIDFNINLYKLYSPKTPEHLLFLCAYNRVVLRQKLLKFIPDLSAKLKDDKGNSFICFSFLSSSYLDENVNPERTDYKIERESTFDYKDYITLDEIKKTSSDNIARMLKEYITPLREEKINRIIQYIGNSAPQYKSLIKHKKKSFCTISPNIGDNKLDLELYKIHQEWELETKNKCNELLSIEIQEIEDYPEYKKNYSEIIENINEQGKSSLAKYILHRKIILDLLENKLKIEGEKYEHEKVVHEIIFPMRSTSEEIDYEKQNLWIIDEKLSYHYLLASDKRLKDLKILDTESERRPDMVIFDNPMIFAEEDSNYTSIVVVEFKRPGRKNYRDRENPITQIYRNVEDIEAGKMTDINGRPINLMENTPFHAYVICDITQKIREFANQASLHEASDKEGYFGYAHFYKTYIEIISYNKLINDSKRRNRILFDKLNLPRK